MSNARPLIAITGSQKPYVYDLPHLLALPDGFEFRFRYRHQWVAPDIRRDLAAANTRHQGNDVILVFYSHETKRLLPLRKCTLVGLEDIGPMVYMRFQVGPFATVDPDVLATVDWAASESAGAQLHALGLRLLGVEQDEALRVSIESGAPLPAGLHLHEATVTAKDMKWPNAPRAADRSKRWAALASVLLHEPNLVGIPMFHVLGFQAEDGAYVAASQIGNDFSLFKKRRYGFRLVEGRRYQLRLVEWCEPPRGRTTQNATANVAFRPQILQLEGSSNLVVGRYDTLEFSFVGERPGYTEVALRVEPCPGNVIVPEEDGAVRATLPVSTLLPEPGFPGGESKEQPWPALFAARIPVHVRHNWMRVASVAAVGLVGLGLFLNGKSLAADPYGPAIQLVGLFLASTAIGEYLERFVKLGKGIRDFSKD